MNFNPFHESSFLTGAEEEEGKKEKTKKVGGDFFVVFLEAQKSRADCTPLGGREGGGTGQSISSCL